MTTTAARPPSTRQPIEPKPRASIAAKTLRTDRWWVAPLLTAAGLIAWVAYATFRVFMQADYFKIGTGFHYLTPFYSPCISNGCDPRRRRVRPVPAELADHPVRGAEPPVPAALPPHLLLLPQGLLPQLLGIAAGLRRPGRSQDLHR